MKVNVNLFAQSGKWKYGGVVEISEQNNFWSNEFKREVIVNQNFATSNAFAEYIVVITHRDDYDEDPSHYFCQRLWGVGEFTF